MNEQREYREVIRDVFIHKDEPDKAELLNRLFPDVPMWARLRAKYQSQFNPLPIPGTPPAVC